MSRERYYVPWQVDVWINGEKVFSHTLDLTDQPVLFAFHRKIMGDTIALIPYVREFQKKYRCKVTVMLPGYLKELMALLYPEIEQEDAVTYEHYATYYPIVGMGPLAFLPVDSRTTPMERLGGELLGINYIAPKPTFTPTKPRTIKQPYVCMSIQASGTMKSWLYPCGWEKIVRYLKKLGYRVLCIDKNVEETNNRCTVKKAVGRVGLHRRGFHNGSRRNAVLR